MAQIKLWLAGAAGIGVAAGAIAAFLVLSPWESSTARASEVEVRIGGRIVGQVAADEGIRQVSDDVGFPVKVPSPVPDSLEMVGVEASDPPPAGLQNVFRTAATNWVAPDGEERLAMRIEQAGEPYDPPAGRAEPFDVGVDGAEAWLQRTENAVGYWLFTQESGFVVLFTGSERDVPEAEVRAMLVSLAN